MSARLPAALALAVLSLGACSDDPAIRVASPADGGAGGGASEVDGNGGAGNGTVDVGGGSNGGTESGAGGSDALAGGGAPVPGDVVIPDAVVLPPGSRAGAYVGRLGEGRGVFVLDRAERLIGLATREDGSATSWFADFGAGTASGPAARFAHAADDGVAGGAASPLGRADGAGPELGLVDGERIARVSGEVAVELEASGRSTLAPVDGTSVIGRWRGEHVDCDSLGEHCSTFATSVEFGAGTLSGSSGVFTAEGTDLFPVPISGAFVPLGDFAEVVFEWNTYDYTGVLHFVPGETERLVMIGRSDRELADHPVVAMVLTRVPDA